MKHNQVDFRTCWVCKRNGKWAVFLKNSRTYEWVGAGYDKCVKLAKWLDANPSN